MRHRERLHVPIAWWVIGTAFALSMVPAVGFYIGPGWGIGVGLVIEVLLGWCFISLGTRIRVDDRGLHVGRGLLEWEWIGTVSALDSEQTRRRLGPEADARAHLVSRPYLKRAVEIRIEDAADPHPYWLIGTRRPEHLALALGAGTPAAEPSTTQVGTEPATD